MLKIFSRDGRHAIHERKGFTLIELLVVIAIIAMRQRFSFLSSPAPAKMRVAPVARAT